MMERRAYVDKLIRLFRQVVGAVLSSWQRTLRLGLITGAVALVTVEVVSCFATSSFPPPAVAHLVAVALALAVGYSCAITLLMGILLKGGLTLIQQLAGEVEIGAHTTIARSAQIMRHDMRRDPEDAIMRTRTHAPSSQPLEPVPVSHMPRIAWMYVEQPLLSPSASRERLAVAASPLRPVHAPASLSRPEATHNVPEGAPSGWHCNGGDTRSQPARVRPPLPSSDGTRSERLWDRVSQVLVGRR